MSHGNYQGGPYTPGPHPGGYRPPPRKSGGGMVVLIVCLVVGILLFLAVALFVLRWVLAASPSVPEAVPAVPSAAGPKPFSPPATATHGPVTAGTLTAADLPAVVGEYAVSDEAGIPAYLLNGSADSFVIVLQTPFAGSGADAYADPVEVAGGRGYCGELEGLLNCNLQTGEFGPLGLTASAGGPSLEETMAIAEAIAAHIG